MCEDRNAAASVTHAATPGVCVCVCVCVWGCVSAATMQEILQEAFDSSALVFTLALLGPRAFRCYMDELAASMEGADDL